MAKHLVIHGRVQGVGFRESMRWQAERLGVSGWVRNRRDGTVEAVVDGPDEAVAAMLSWCASGPPGARVTEVAMSEAAGGCACFEVRPTA